MPYVDMPVAELTAYQVQEKYDQAAKLIGEAELLLADVYWNFTVAGDETGVKRVTEVFETVQAARIRTEDEAIACRERTRKEAARADRH